jgi:hypothetical protein
LLPFAAAVVQGCRRRLNREQWVCLTIVGIMMLFNSAAGDSIIYWGGGTSVGARHILVTIPFICLLAPLLPSNRVTRAVLVALVGYSSFAMLLATAIEPRIPYEYDNPWQFYLPNYLFGSFHLNDSPLFGATPIIDRSIAFNLGHFVTKALLLPAAAQLLPLLLLFLPFTWFGPLAALTGRVQKVVLTLALLVALGLPVVKSQTLARTEPSSGHFYQGLLFDEKPGWPACRNNSARSRHIFFRSMANIT